ncbi:DUF481 domain-containing protein [Haliea sp. E17]|uniref:DUF481 domain-containing protein n=1 Tax=Haliea sp. E17 TaxID=3401576 RepID=UPI003AAC95A0
MNRFLGAALFAGALALGIGGARAESEAIATEIPVTPDEVTMLDGSVIRGKVLSVRDGALELETDFAGTLAIPMEKVSDIRTAAPVVMELVDDTVIEDQPLVVEQQQLVVSGVAADGEVPDLEDLLLVNPEPWELGQGYKWTGLVNFALTMERGNTDTDELDYRLESVWRSEKDRYTLRYFGELDEVNGLKNADNWTVQGKYDYFFDGPAYGGIQAYAEADKFADLDLRYYIGPYIGREFYTDPIFALSADAGLAYVNEDYIVAPDNDYPGATWNIDFTSNYLGGDSRLYFLQNGLWNLNNTSDVVVNTTFGLAFPLLWNFEAAAEVLLEYDSGVPDTVDELDQTYSVRLGYTW